MEDDLIFFCSILEFGKGSKALKIGRNLGALGGTILLGDGTVANNLLNILGITEIRKEIFITIIDQKTEDLIYEEMSNEFKLDKPNHGIAFSVPLKSCLGIGEMGTVSNPQKEGVSDLEAIFAIVDKGLSDDVLESAQRAGSTGGTIIHGRGTAVEETEKLFNITIEPEKEIILIISNKDNTDKIVNTINQNLDMEESNKGIIFVLDVSRSLGIYKG
mgnify:CR=1 FL=1